MKTATHPSTPRRDFSGDASLLRIAALAAFIGALSTVAARVLLMMIRFFTDLFFYGKFSFAKKIIPFDMYFSAGYGTTGTQSSEKPGTLHVGAEN